MNTRNNFINPLLTDMYQLTMAYAYWKNNRHEDPAVFELFFRRCPFGGEFTVFAGLNEVLDFVKDFHFTEEDIEYIKIIMPDCDPEFFEWLKAADCSKIQIYAIQEGTIVFPRVPLIRVEGPLAIAQMLETTLLNLVNYPSLIATNAARFRLAAGDNAILLEFGLRRAQGPDGGMSASRYSYLGGFDGTSNMLAGKLYGIPVKGTHAHSYVQVYTYSDKIYNPMLLNQIIGGEMDFVSVAMDYATIVKRLFPQTNPNPGELLAFISYALAHSKNFLALVDTYDTLKSGVPNAIAVAMALEDFGYEPKGIRLDSGDLAFLSREARDMFKNAARRFYRNRLESLAICASNDINEEILRQLKSQGHEIDIFGIGTNLVTCQAQPALGCVYKLVEINGEPRIKISNNPEKITIPGRKIAFRLYDKIGSPVADLIIREGDRIPVPGKKILCVHPSDGFKRFYFTPASVQNLHQLFWNGQSVSGVRSLKESRSALSEEISRLRPDHLRPVNPTPYKISVGEELFARMEDLRRKESPIEELE